MCFIPDILPEKAQDRKSKILKGGIIVPMTGISNPFLALNGKIVRLSAARISPFDHGFLYGDGVYETLRTYGGTVILDFAAHLGRLRQSALRLALPLPFSDAEIISVAEEIVRLNRFPESRIRLSLTRGENGFEFIGANSPTFMISGSALMDYQPYTAGVDLVSIVMERTEPQIKSIALLPMVLGKQAAQQAQAFDTIFLDHQGYVTEGTVFNIVYRQGDALVNADQTTVLPGTAQRILIGLAQQAGYRCHSRRFGIAELVGADEVIITNSLFGALPVKSVDGKPISQSPGELFHACGTKILAEMARRSGD
jgi:branched-subunit amino acid aminotransferase/4-amino-4-deoxychorismate lyase